MIYKPKHFELQELCCPHVFYKYREQSWQFLDPRQLVLLDWVRNRYGPVFINNWFETYGKSEYIKAIANKITKELPVIASELPDIPGLMLSERGLRCNICSLYLEKTNKGIIYMSGHGLGMADDLTIQGKTSEEVRQDIIKNKNIVPFPLRLEKNKSWLHLDCEDNFKGIKVYEF